MRWRLLPALSQERCNDCSSQLISSSHSCVEHAGQPLIWRALRRRCDDAISWQRHQLCQRYASSEGNLMSSSHTHPRPLRQAVQSGWDDLPQCEQHRQAVAIVRPCCSQRARRFSHSLWWIQTTSLGERDQGTGGWAVLLKCCGSV